MPIDSPGLTNSADRIFLDLPYSTQAVNLLSALIDQNPGPVYAYDLDCHVTLWNKACEGIYGWTASETLGQPLPFSADDLQQEARKVYAISGGHGHPEDSLVTRQRRDGGTVALRMSSAALRSEDGGIVGTLVVEQVEQGHTHPAIDSRHLELKRQYELLLGLAKDQALFNQDFPQAFHRFTEVSAHTLGIARASVWLLREGRWIECQDLYDVDGNRHSGGPRVLAADFPSYARALEFNDATDLGDVRPDPSMEGLSDIYLDANRNHSQLDAAIRLSGKIVGVLCYEHVGSPRAWTWEERNFAMGMAALLSQLLETNERRAAQAKASYLAQYDALTGLPNRQLAKERLQQVLATSQRSGDRVGVLYLDLDRFKSINDSLGHAAGDEILKQASDRINGCLRATDTVAHLGSDEFVVVAAQVANTEDVVGLGQRLIQSLAQPYAVMGRGVTCAASVGVAVGPEHGTDAATLLKHADTAMYAAKQAGRNNLRVYRKDLSSSALQDLSLEAGLRQALQQQEFVVHYQPQYRLMQRRLVGVEALVRWRGQDGSLILPDRFVPLAEERGLISAIGQWVLSQACEQNAKWQQAGLGVFPIAVNVSAYQLKRGGFVEDVLARLREAGLAAQQLKLEVTETAMLDDVQTVRSALDELAGHGVRLCLDDFGTGYSSLSNLSQFPVHTIKIDRSFVQNLTENPKDAEITRAIIGLGKSLGKFVVAEGVESTSQLAVLLDYGCDAAQGFLFQEPIAAGEFTRTLQMQGGRIDSERVDSN